jgi:hypothetical protein
MYSRRMGQLFRIALFHRIKESRPASLFKGQMDQQR